MTISILLLVVLLIILVCSKEDKPWKNTHCKYCKMLGHSFTQCSKLNVLQKTALKTLAEEERYG